MRKLITLAAIVLTCLSANLAVAREDSPSAVLKLDQVPALVKTAILERSGEGKGKLGEILKVTEDGEIRYDVEITKGKRERSFSVAPDGKLLSWQVFMPEIPEAARKTIREQSEKAKLGDIDRVMDEDKVTFEVTITKEGRETSFSVAPDGKLLTMQVLLTETPVKVQAGIRKQAGAAVIKSIEKNTSDEEMAYDIEGTRDGKKISFSVDAEGKLQDD